MATRRPRDALSATVFTEGTRIVASEETSLPAGFSTCQCFTVSCRTCDVEFGDEEYGYGIHFETVEAALKRLTEDGWWYTQTGVQCGPCAAKETCASDGHAWEEWHACGCNGRIPSHKTPMEIRVCASCSEFDERPAVRN